MNPQLAHWCPWASYMPRGYRTEKAIEEHIIALVQTSMTQKEVADKVGISPRQVSRIWKRASVRQASASSLAASEAAHHRVLGDIAKHQAQLLSVLQNLEGVDVFKPQFDEMNQLLSDQEGKWSIEQCQLLRDKDGIFSIGLRAENRVEWAYLQQHLEGHSLWGLIRSWKSAMIRDVESRLGLMSILRRRVEAQVKDGGVGLKIVAADPGTRHPGYLHPYYLNLLYSQVSLTVRGTEYPLKRPEEFITDEARRVSLEGFFVIAPKTRGQLDRAVEFFIHSQTDMVGSREARRSAKAYQEALERTQELRREVRKILLSPGLAGTCELCGPYVS